MRDRLQKGGIFLIQTYATIQELKLEAEELEVNKTRLCTHLRRDLVEFAKEVYGEEEESLDPSVIRDMLEQLSELGKRYLGVKIMIATEPKIEPYFFKRI